MQQVWRYTAADAVYSRRCDDSLVPSSN
ncbi:hypothetical protein NP493_574g01000 [Ridgeia piscesae]|uniref:Uncharacterized protein n=1 Tax=Ridgeia piscesae TaxID=27915 RepID=A0AAD9NSK2_RIDPI|nr:hypothetical protein NP493_574g01000 [Ridgeia piscesae]